MLIKSSGLNIDTYEDAIVEVSGRDIDRDSFSPSEEVLREIAERVARNGSTASPGFCVIPSTRHLVGTRGELDSLIEKILAGLLTTWKAMGSNAISHVNYLYMSGRRADSYYRESNVSVEKSQLIGIPQTSFFLHTDFLRIQYSAISYGRFRNVAGGTFRIFDALRLYEDEGISIEELVIPKVSVKKTRTINDAHYYYVAKPEIEKIHRDYLRDIDIDTRESPLIILSNRYPFDGILHGPTPISKVNSNLEWRRPSYLATIAAQRLSDAEASVIS